MKKMIFLKVKNSYNKKLVTWLDLNLQVALLSKLLRFGLSTLSSIEFILFFSNSKTTSLKSLILDKLKNSSCELLSHIYLFSYLFFIYVCVQ